MDLEKTIKILKDYNSEDLFKVRQETGYINPHDFPSLDLVQTILLSEILEKLNKKEEGIKVELEELNKTQILKHLERSGENIAEYEKLSKEDIIKKMGE